MNLCVSRGTESSQIFLCSEDYFFPPIFGWTNPLNWTLADLIMQCEQITWQTDLIMQHEQIIWHVTTTKMFNVEWWSTFFFIIIVINKRFVNICSLLIYMFVIYMCDEPKKRCIKRSVWRSFSRLRRTDRSYRPECDGSASYRIFQRHAVVAEDSARTTNTSKKC